ncbi:WbqC family protein [Desulfotalea psychrophila]|uniref:WbqC-like protein n=1 Tax=Desulfotalea psychrophila (strain LSv54 / DSM 12343) TaxID=177439 RepID=Q6AS92_DESPS|nr:WbqC family protein [Desulfotalea psychrophila]CAG34771.1 hypothetical protein DP0042 [Desulfotalea psychrophila LSv54]
MVIAVMQPYLFPYFGYYQLVNCADKFVVYDDVNYIKGGYINRNNILVKGQSQRFTVPVPGASSNKKIKELSFSSDVKKVLSTIQQSYSKALFFNEIFPIVEAILTYEDRSLAEVCKQSLSQVFAYLGVEKEIIKSSELDYDHSLSAADRLIDITRRFGANKYINSIGGQSLYNKDYFQSNGIELSFIKMDEVSYTQANNKFVPYLSMIDVLMWCKKERVVEMLKSYKMV